MFIGKAFRSQALRKTRIYLRSRRSSTLTMARQAKIHLILDFDGTVVEDNTIPLLDYLRPPRSPVEYQSFVDPYMRDYEDHVQRYEPRKTQRKTLAEEYNYLDSLVNVERRSIERIEASGWLKGLHWSPGNLSVFDNAAAKIQIERPLSWRNGFLELVQRVWKEDGRVDILSVNWSEQFLRALLRRQFGASLGLNKIRVYCNEIDPAGSGNFSRYNIFADELKLSWRSPDTPPDPGSRGLWTASDKSKVMKHIIETSGLSEATVVYIGDSKTDLGCIMEADVGICVRDGSDIDEHVSLKEALDRLHITQIPVGRDSKPAESDIQVVVLYTPDFSVVLQLLFGE